MLTPALMAAALSAILLTAASLSAPHTPLALLTLVSGDTWVRFGVFGFCTPEGCTRLWPYRSPLLDGSQRYLMLLPIAAVAEVALAALAASGRRAVTVARFGALVGGGCVFALYALRAGAKWPIEGINGGAGDLCGVGGGVGAITAWLLS
ncbi:hypothetical protein CC85DRAFT_285251 [Cutaneotrichosporon oleaginosum]|uniref:Uncharacterized protein n=1 Tax=Cutaneotrichosporon oleaginosum TaxID=879819 RepID=A0A0J0XNL3_9TREE|nr:uncharacterized protein CC85DRAFT_285251 [Cutaneotrichosporon oleaginosum]KLT42711.1 hypothetical protein CC85DRAFT_285251 [Cutaneotrichosporon oleaginosum]TXT09570.1 hypothetical protein COLE_03504 [Cutaneotrichosporon oleaginosum]